MFEQSDEAKRLSSALREPRHVLVAVDVGAVTEAPRLAEVRPALPTTPPQAAKVCANCNKSKPFAAYREHHGSPDGFMRFCKTCQTAKRKKRKAEREGAANV